MRAKIAFFLISILISSLFMMLAPVHSSAVESVKVYVDPPAVIDPNGLFNVSVKADNLVDLEGAEWILTWDPTLLRAVNMTEIMFHEVTPQSEWDNIWQVFHTIDLGQAGYCYLWQDLDRAAAGGYAPISGNHTMAIITFQVLGVGGCPLQFIRYFTKLGDSNGEPIARDVTDGFFSNSIPPLPPVPVEPSKVRIYVDPRRVRNESLAVNETFTVDVRIDSLTNHSSITSIWLSLSWDPTLLNCTNLTTNQSWHNERWWIDGEWGEYWHPPRTPGQGVFANFTLATITFAVKGIGSCRLHIQTCWLFEEASAPGVPMSYTSVDGYFSNRLNGDLNGDNTVNLLDALRLAQSFGAYWNGYKWNEEADINGDQWVDIFDAILLGKFFGHTL